MEKILDTFLDRVRLDAVAKLKNADTTATRSSLPQRRS